MGAAEDEGKEIRHILDETTVAHKREIVQHILDTDEPGKETW